MIKCKMWRETQSDKQKNQSTESTYFCFFKTSYDNLIQDLWINECFLKLGGENQEYCLKPHQQKTKLWLDKNEQSLLASWIDLKLLWWLLNITYCKFAIIILLLNITSILVIIFIKQTHLKFASSYFIYNHLIDIS